MKDEAKELFKKLAEEFLEPFTPTKPTALAWDKPVDDSLYSVETVKLLRFAVDDTVTYLEFHFGSKECNASTFMHVTLYSNYGDGITRLRKYVYPRRKGPKLYEKYAKYLED